ncbi:hypothetical protein HYFRA_00009124 [Hymenoscyphus fraxineus]|uniref:Uncharacterized protein n=1 Tax=Hymenoscyphus fraxineus TaxID=746836 RepID=A0A9N9KV31_9HELO|nr:hypothetical protein HYFRA_00009124 [Hymenoscyphus fraxineus]
MGTDQNAHMCGSGRSECENTYEYMAKDLALRSPCADNDSIKKGGVEGVRAVCTERVKKWETGIKKNNAWLKERQAQESRGEFWW